MVKKDLPLHPYAGAFFAEMAMGKRTLLGTMSAGQDEANHNGLIPVIEEVRTRLLYIPRIKRILTDVMNIKKSLLILWETSAGRKGFYFKKRICDLLICGIITAQNAVIWSFPYRSKDRHLAESQTGKHPGLVHKVYGIITAQNAVIGNSGNSAAHCCLDF